MAAGRPATFADELLSFIAPSHREDINFFGFIEVDIEAELAKLDDGWRPLRPTRALRVGGVRDVPNVRDQSG
ncbi:hypothetical protein ACQEVF_48685 [Nonomuraea polychroma]|uniref:hypothetical protein n=1 Tax=Nonomuraea polychroma TaxID=46176 RepID=UPI003D8CB3E3